MSADEEPARWSWEVRNGDGQIGADGKLLDWFAKPADEIVRECLGMLLLRTPEPRWVEMAGWQVRVWQTGGPDVARTVDDYLRELRQVV